MIGKIQVFGERCSGTNYLECLLTQNCLSIEISRAFGCKHFFCMPGVEDAEDHLFVVIYRNPSDWLRSLHRRPHHAAPPLRNVTFSEFIREEWWCIYDETSGQFPGHPKYSKEMKHERSPETGERFANVMKMRTAKIRDWMSLEDKAGNFVYVRYEDLVDDPGGFIAQLANSYAIRRTPQFHGVENYKGLPNHTFKRASYKPINPKDQTLIINELDLEIERSIGYDITWESRKQARRGR